MSIKRLSYPRLSNLVVFLSFFLITQFLNAQYVDVCNNNEPPIFKGEARDILCQINSEFPTSAYIEVGEGTNYPKASDIDFFSKNLLVVSAFTIDISYTFINYDFLFLEGANINMRPGVDLTLNRSNLYSCDGMWQGIFLNHGCKIITKNNTRIEDALTAINATNINDASLEIENTTFNRNLIGIFLKKQPSSNPTDITLISKLDNNTFSCTAPLNSGPNDITRSGIESDGNVYNFSSKGNNFTSMEYGILGYNEPFAKYSIISGENNKFLNIKVNGIELGDGSLRLKRNDFHNCALNAILLRKGYESKIESNCSFVIDNNVESVSPKILNGINVNRLVNECCFNIEDCTFRDETTHLNSEDPNRNSVRLIRINLEEIYKSELSIRDCNLMLNSNDGNAILLDGSNSPSSKIDIIENFFRFGESTGPAGNVGIKSQGSDKHNMRIIGNDFIGSTANGAVTNIGIQLFFSEGLNNLVQGNNFESGLLFNPVDESYTPIIFNCISVTNFQNTTFCQNTNIGGRNLISFSQMNLNTIYSENISQIGTILRINNGGIITDQKDRGNQFEPLFLNGELIGVPRQAICDPTTAQLSIITVHTDQSESYLGNWNPYHPKTIDPDNDNEWWTKVGTNGSPNLFCTQQVAGPSTNSLIGSAALESALLNNSIDQYFNDSREIWLLKRSSYFNIKNRFGEINIEDPINQFIEVHDNDNIGKLFMVSKLLKQVASSENRNSILENAQELNNSIHGTIVPEMNEIFINNFLINHYLDENIETDQLAIDQLYSIALQDPRFGGISVSKARSILSTCFEAGIEDVIDLNDDDNKIVAYTNVDERKFKTSVFSKSSLVKIYPIPVQDVLNIEALNNGTVQIFNALGNSVYTANFSTNTKLNLSRLNTGIYFCEFVFENGDNVIKKIIVK